MSDRSSKRVSTAIVLYYANHPRAPYRCPTCGRLMRRRGPNDPAYCSYDCGVTGQPERVRVARWGRGNTV